MGGNRILSISEMTMRVTSAACIRIVEPIRRRMSGLVLSRCSKDWKSGLSSDARSFSNQLMSTGRDPAHLRKGETAALRHAERISNYARANGVQRAMGVQVAMRSLILM